MRIEIFKAVLVLMLLSISATAVSESRPVLLKVQSTYPTNLPGLGTNLLWIAEKISIITDNKVRLKVYEPNKLVGPLEVLDAVSRKKISAGYATPGFWAGKMSAAPFFSSFPFGPEAGEYLAWLYHGDGNTLRQTMYDKSGYTVHSLLCGLIGPETSGWFKQPVQTAEDLNGLRMRFFGLGAKVMEKLGVSTSLLPAAEVFPALEKGVIDATEFSMPAIDERLGLYKIAKYNYYPGWHQPSTVFELLVNQEIWQGLSESQQVLLDTTCRAVTLESFSYTEAIQASVMKRNAEKHGVNNKIWSVKMLKRFEEAWHQVAAEEATKDPFFKEVWDNYRAFHEQYTLWETYAFLPRLAPQ